MRSWKGQDWEAMERLHAKGYISHPKSKSKSVVVTEEGVKRSRELFEKYFVTSR
jgi:Mn-dependent DtxR family transcriptional regulator